MTAVADFKIILKHPLIIGDAAPEDDQEEREIPFRLESNFLIHERCLLQYEVRGLTVANQNPTVEINNKTVGNISVNDITGAGNDYIADKVWFQQSMVVEPGQLKPGNNTLEIKAPSWAHTTTHNKYDDFNIRNIVLMYKTDSRR